jgi:hypothetical protein
MINQKPRMQPRSLAAFGQARSEADRLGVLRFCKHPDEIPAAQMNYYNPARNAVRGAIRHGTGVQGMNVVATALRTQAAQVHGPNRSRLLINARRIEVVGNGLAGRSLTWRPDWQLQYDCAGVELVVHPWLHVLENGAEKFIDVSASGFCNTTTAPQAAAQTIYYGCLASNISIAASNIEVWDATTGTSYVADPSATDLLQLMVTWCQDVVAYWPRV